MITNEVGLCKADFVTLDELIDLCGVCPGTWALDSYSSPQMKHNDLNNSWLWLFL